MLFFCLEFANPGDNAYTPSRKRMKHPGLEIHSKGIMGAYRDLCGHIVTCRAPDSQQVGTPIPESSRQE